MLRVLIGGRGFRSQAAGYFREVIQQRLVGKVAPIDVEFEFHTEERRLTSSLSNSIAPHHMRRRSVSRPAGLFNTSGTALRILAGNTHCQAHSRGALGYFARSAPGSATLPGPAVTSASCCACTRLK